VSFAAITLCVTFQRVFIIVIDVVYFVMTQSGTFGYTLVYSTSEKHRKFVAFYLGRRECEFSYLEVFPVLHCLIK